MDVKRPKLVIEVEGLEELEQRVDLISDKITQVLDDVAVALATLTEIQDANIKIGVNVEQGDNGNE